MSGRKCVKKDSWAAGEKWRSRKDAIWSQETAGMVGSEAMVVVELPGVGRGRAGAGMINTCKVCTLHQDTGPSHFHLSCSKHLLNIKTNHEHSSGIDQH